MTYGWLLKPVGAQALGDKGLRRPNVIFICLDFYNFHLWAFFLPFKTFNIAPLQKILMVKWYFRLPQGDGTMNTNLRQGVKGKLKSCQTKGNF